MEVKDWVKSRYKWAMENYERGGDMFVECWDEAEYLEALEDAGGDFEQANRFLERLRSIFEERQADARYYRENW